MSDADRSFSLDNPAEIYRRFSRMETMHLRAYLEDVRRLGEMRFFKQIPAKAQIKWDGTTREAHGVMDEPDDEALRAVITVFRQLYLPGEPHCFSKAVKCLKRSVHDRDGPQRAQALADLDAHLDAARMVLQTGAFFRINIGTRDLTTHDLIDTYFHGKYLHGANEKTVLADALDQTPFARFGLYHVMYRLAGVYWIVGNVVELALAVPELVDADR